MQRAAVNTKTFRPRRMIVATFLAALLALALTLSAPAAAQEETIAQPANETRAAAKDEDASSGQPKQSVQGSGQQTGDATEGDDEQAAARVADPLQDAAVTIESDGGTVERIEIAAADCDVTKGETVTVSDENGEPATFTNIGDSATDGAANIEATQDQIVIDDFDPNDLGEDFGAEGDENAEVTDSMGITCGRDAAAATDDDNDGANGDGGTADDARTVDDLENLSCAELLVLFRAESGGQYGGADRFADADVRAQIEVCLKQEIVGGTAAKGNLPNTGGLSLLGLAVLGIVSAAAGLSVIRGGRR